MLLQNIHDIYGSHFKYYFPGEPGLADCLSHNFPSSFIYHLCILMRQARTVHILNAVQCGWNMRES